jgi:hypothetical protein
MLPDLLFQGIFVYHLGVIPTDHSPFYSRLLISVAFNTLMVYTKELFPTSLRSETGDWDEGFRGLGRESAIASNRA